MKNAFALQKLHTLFWEKLEVLLCKYVGKLSMLTNDGLSSRLFCTGLEEENGLQ